MSGPRRFLALALWMCGCVHATAQVIPLPSDISVAFTASPNTNLHPGEPIALALSVTNHGPVPVTGFAILSTHIDNLFYIDHREADCEGMVGAIVDLEDDTYGLLIWHFSNYIGAAELGVGETHTCHMRGRLNALAPPVTSFGFGLADSWSDPDASNNAATISLVRAATTPVPTLSGMWMMLLAGLLIVGVAGRRRHSADRCFHTA